jgi:hypothetical protein
MRAESEVMPKRAKKGDKPDEREPYPNLEKFPALRRALAIHRAMVKGKTREEAVRLAVAELGPRRRPARPAKRGKEGKPQLEAASQPKRVPKRKPSRATKRER